MDQKIIDNYLRGKMENFNKFCGFFRSPFSFSFFCLFLVHFLLFLSNNVDLAYKNNLEGIAILIKVSFFVQSIFYLTANVSFLEKILNPNEKQFPEIYLRNQVPQENNILILTLIVFAFFTDPFSGILVTINFFIHYFIKNKLVKFEN